MLVRLRVLALFAAAAPFAFADVKFTTPSGAAAGEDITVTWSDSGQKPASTDLAGYTVLLMVGGAKDPAATPASADCISVSSAGSGTHAEGTTLKFSVPAGTGPPDSNAYFLKISSAPKTGTGMVINYSSRFSISGMTGVWPGGATGPYEAAFKAAGSAVPVTSNTVDGSAGVVPGADPSAGISYQLQTAGTIRYAPMMPSPIPKITATNTAPQYAPSAWVLATEFLPLPSVVTTITAVGTFTTTKRENTGTAAPMPSNDMQRFLARWKD